MLGARGPAKRLRRPYSTTREWTPTREMTVEMSLIVQYLYFHCSLYSTVLLVHRYLHSASKEMRLAVPARADLQ